jgi:hypothetical protein
MSQAVANPEDMERFARELKQFNAQLASSMKRLNGQFALRSNLARSRASEVRPRVPADDASLESVPAFIGSADSFLVTQSATFA